MSRDARQAILTGRLYTGGLGARAIHLLGAGLVVAVFAGLSLARPAAQELGTIVFPTSGAPTAQPAFLEGVKYLHSFQFDEAAVAFKRAQEADPQFAMAYWGEAMSYNHPLWAQQDLKAAIAALEKIDPTPEGRLGKAKLPTEKALLEAAQVLFFSPGDKLARDTAYSEMMARLHARWPDDHEIATLYALSLLGTVRPGDRGFRRQALAAAVAQQVFQANPKHPGAAHFVIHAFDDPEHAPLGLPAARAYAAIAPAAAHALHMPSHIFVQLGMWEDARQSNIAAYNAAVDVNTRMKLAEGREDFHTLSWLAYANLMLGNTEEAARNVDAAKAAADRNPKSAGIRDGYLNMRARLILETGSWEKLPLAEPPTAASGDAHAGMPGMAMPPSAASSGWTFITGYSAAKLGDTAIANAATARLRSVREALDAAKNSYAAKNVAIMEKEIEAVTRTAAGARDEGLRLAKEAAEIEATLSAPSGPPDPMKPAWELYGELLLDAGQAAEAVRAFEQSLLRTPNRTPSVLGLARAAAKATEETKRFLASWH